MNGTRLVVLQEVLLWLIRMGDLTHRFPAGNPAWQVFRRGRTALLAEIPAKSAESRPEYLPNLRLEMALREIRVTWVIRDITRRKVAETQLALRNAELETTRQALRAAHREQKQVHSSLHTLRGDLDERTAQAEQAQTQLRDWSTHLREAHEAERGRLAHEIHDELGQTLVALKMDIAALQSHSGDVEFLEARLPHMQALLDAAIHSFRRITADLRPSALDDLGLVAAIDWQCQEFQRRTGIHCRLHSQLDYILIELRVATAVFRMYQEILRNVERHAHATQVEVTLERQDNSLLLQVQDDGQGIAAEKITDSQSLGLFGLREERR